MARCRRPLLQVLSLHCLDFRMPGYEHPRRAKAAALAAPSSGRAEVGMRHMSAPVVLVDGIAAYPAVGELLGTNRWLQADHIEQKHHGRAAFGQR